MRVSFTGLRYCILWYQVKERVKKKERKGERRKEQLQNEERKGNKLLSEVSLQGE